MNVGFLLEREDVFRGTKDDTQLDVLISLFRRPPITTQSISGLMAAKATPGAELRPVV